MNEDQFTALLAYIDGKIDEKISDAFGRDGLHEAIKLYELEKELRYAFDGYRV